MLRNRRFAPRKDNDEFTKDEDSWRCDATELSQMSHGRRGWRTSFVR